MCTGLRPHSSQSGAGLLTTQSALQSALCQLPSHRPRARRLEAGDNDHLGRCIALLASTLGRGVDHHSQCVAGGMGGAERSKVDKRLVEGRMRRKVIRVTYVRRNKPPPLLDSVWMSTHSANGHTGQSSGREQHFRTTSCPWLACLLGMPREHAEHATTRQGFFPEREKTKS